MCLDKCNDLIYWNQWTKATSFFLKYIRRQDISQQTGRIEATPKTLVALVLGKGVAGAGLRYPLISKCWPAAGLLQLMYEKQ